MGGAAAPGGGAATVRGKGEGLAVPLMLLPALLLLSLNNICLTIMHNLYQLNSAQSLSANYYVLPLS